MLLFEFFDLPLETGVLLLSALVFFGFTCSTFPTGKEGRVRQASDRFSRESDLVNSLLFTSKEIDGFSLFGL
jgi:hypothetical protein